MTPLSYFATKIQAEVLHRRDELLAAYDRLPDTSMYWSFVDLVSSSNYRLTHGAKEGYVRGESFFTLVGEAVSPPDAIHRVKELGDGVLLASREFRPLFEACVLIGQVSHQLAQVAGDQRYPFAVRTAIGYGPAKRLPSRPMDDYLGSPIDTLARLSTIATPNDLVVTRTSLDPNRQLLDEYRDFASLSGPHQLSETQSKGMVEPIYYYRVAINRELAGGFESGFSDWRR